MCTGGFRSRAGIERALTEDGIDLVGIGRPAAADPDWTRRLLQPPNSSSSTSAIHNKSSTSKEGYDKCIDYKVTGGKWLQTLVPLKIVGGGMTTLWHELQMSRIARGKETRVEWSFERLLIVEFLSSRMALSVSVALCVAVLSWTAAAILR